MKKAENTRALLRTLVALGVFYGIFAVCTVVFIPDYWDNVFRALNRMRTGR